jgi:tripartite-type tricarboxylate transporter receptor subunit TctC
MAPIVGRLLGQSIIIENKAGASGMLGAQTVAAETRGDGYLLAQFHGTCFRLPAMMARAPYAVPEDFTWIIQLVGYSYGVVVRADAPWRTWQEFAAHVRANPGSVSYGTAGVGTTQHITMERVGRQLGLDWLHVPFRGGGDDVQALLAGQLHAVASSTLWAELVQSGTLRLLVSFGAERIRRFAFAPTLRECGIDIAQTSPYGLVGPKGMDPGVVRVLHDACHAALTDPDHLAVLGRLDMPLAYLDSAGYAAVAPRLLADASADVRALGLRMN